MSEFQVAGLLMIVTGSIPIYLLANHIEKEKHYSLFTGWDPAKITDEDACGKILCKGLRSFSVALAVLGLAIFFNMVRGELFVVAGIAVTLAPMLFYILRAKNLYGK